MTHPVLKCGPSMKRLLYCRAAGQGRYPRMRLPCGATRLTLKAPPSHPPLPSMKAHQTILPWLDRLLPAAIVHGSTPSELLRARTGSNMNFIPYRGAAPAITDLLGNQIQVGMSSKAVMLPLINAGKLRGLAVTSDDRWPELPDVPTLYEWMDKYKAADEMKRLARVLLSSGDLGRPFMGPPALPADKIKILRDSFSKAMTDPALVADAEKRRWDLDPTTGAELEATAKEIMIQPPEVIARMKKFLAD